MKTILKILASLFCISFIIIGCNEYNKAVIVNSDVIDEEVKATIILWYYWESENVQNELLNLVDDFNKSQEKCNVEIEYVSFDDFQNQLSLSPITSKSPDIALIDSAYNAYYANMGILKDITYEVNKLTNIEKYNKYAMDTCRFDDKVYGIPFGIEYVGLYYNKQMLEENNCDVPRTWDELREVAKKTTKKNVYGFGMSAMSNEQGTFEFLPLLWSTETSTLKIGNSEGVKSFKFLLNLINDGSMSNSTVNWTEADTMEQFISGNIAMMFNTTAKIPELEKRAYNIDWDITHIPIYKENITIEGGDNFVVIEGDKVEESLEFLKYILTERNINKYVNNLGFISPTEFENNKGDEMALERKLNNVSQISKGREITCKWPNISNAISNSLTECISGKASPKMAAEKAQNSINETMK